MLRYVVAYFTAFLVMVPLDMVWLRKVGDLVYRPDIGSLLTDKPNLAAGAAFYLLYEVGILIFGVSAGWRSGHWTAAAGYGALFGLFCYATYDLTNMATLKIWTLRVTIVDVAWGIFVSGLAATAAYWASRRFGA